MVFEPEPLAYRPVYEECFSDYFVGWKIPPKTRVQTVHRIVTHDEQMIWPDMEIFAKRERRL